MPEIATKWDLGNSAGCSPVQRPIDNGIEGNLRCHFWNNWEMGEYLYRVKLLTAFHITHLQFLSLEIISNPPLKMTNPCLAREASLR